MKINFRQGIVSYQAGGFLQVNGNNVDILAANKPVTITIAHRTTNYTHSEDNAAPSAWGPFAVPGDYYLYWDFNPLTFERTFGYTTTLPLAQSFAPSTGIPDRTWFDTTNNIHYVLVGASWKEVIRVYAAHYDGSSTFSSLSIASPAFTGTQIGNTNTISSGRILFAESSTPMRRTDGTFFTTEDQFFVNQSRVDAVRLESNITRVLSTSALTQYQVVAWTAAGKVSSAEYSDTGTTVVGILTETLMSSNEVGSVIIQGTVTNPAWTWTSGAGGVVVGSKLWILNGELTPIDPHVSNPVGNPTKQVPVARVLSDDTIIFEQGLGGVGPQGPKGVADGLIYADLNVIGAVSLSHTPTNLAQPIAAGINHPSIKAVEEGNLALAIHTHTATSISYSPGNGISAITTQAAINELALEKLNIAGGTMTGSLLLNADPITNLGAATKAYVDNTHDATKLNLTGGTMTGQLLLPIAGSPIDPQSAITKAYFDANSSSGLLDMIPYSDVSLDSITSTKDSFHIVSTAGGGLAIEPVSVAGTPDSGYDFAGAPLLYEYAKAPDDFSVTYGVVTTDGSRVMWNDNAAGNPKTVHIRDLVIPFDLTSATNDIEATYTSGDANGGNGIFQFNNDGTKMYSSYNINDVVWEYTLSTPYDPNTASAGVSSTILSPGTNGNYIFSEDGTYLYSTVVGEVQTIYNWELLTPWDITTIPGVFGAIPTSFVVVAADLPNIGGFFDFYLAVNSTGTKIYSVSRDGDFANFYVNSWDLSVAHDLTTAVFDVGFGTVVLPPPFNDTGIRTWQVADGGTKAYIYTDTRINAYDLTVGDATQDGNGVSTSLRYDNTTVLETTTTGVEITGILSFAPDGSSATSPQLVIPNYTTGTLPATTFEGGLVYNSTLKELTYTDGTSWRTVGGVTNPLSSDLDTGGFSIVTANISTDTSADTIIIRGGNNTYSGGYQRSGSVLTYGGNGTTGNDGGYVGIYGGGSSGSGYGGSISSYGGASSGGRGASTYLYGGTPYSGGYVYISGGNSNGVGVGGDVTIHSGSSVVDTAGTLTLLAGDSDSGSAGDVVVEAGSITGSGYSAHGGTVYITSGSAYSSGYGSAGSIILATGTGPVLGSVVVKSINNTTSGVITIHSTGAYANKVNISVQAGMEADTMFILPPDNGGVGNVLQTDGFGVTSWVSGSVGLLDMAPYSDVSLDSITSTKDKFALTINGTIGTQLEYTPATGFDSISLVADNATAVNPNGFSNVFWKPDGLTYYIVTDYIDATHLEVTEYVVGTAFDIFDPVSNTPHSILVPSLGGEFGLIWFSQDGTKLVMASGDDLHQFSLPAWDLTSVTFTQSSLNFFAFAPRAYSITSDGAYLYVIKWNTSISEIYQYSVIADGDITSISYVATFDFTTIFPAFDGIPRGISADIIGQKIFVIIDDNFTTRHMYEMHMSTNFLLSSMTLFNVNSVTLTYDTRALRGSWNPLGTKYYELHTNTVNFVYQYSSNASGGGTSANLYHDDVKKLETTNTGVGIYGQLGLPKHTTINLPTNTVEGGLVYDSTIKGLKVYAGPPGGWTTVGGVVGITIQEEGVEVLTGVTTLDFVGSTVSATSTGGSPAGNDVTITITAGTSDSTNALQSATTTVDVSASPAPSTGQVLTATADTTATWQSPKVFIESSKNTFVGAEPGFSRTGVVDSTFVGYQAGYFVTTGDNNTTLGSEAGYSISTGSNNTAVGQKSLYGNPSNKLTGTQNTGLGAATMWSIVGAAAHNTSIGSYSGWGVTTGTNNTSLGSNNAQNITTGTNNIIIGAFAGPTTNTSNQLFIDVAATDTPLIHGDFSTNDVTINGNLIVTGTGGIATTTASIQTTDATPTTLQTIAIPSGQERIIVAKVIGHENETGSPDTNDMTWKHMTLGVKNIAGTVSIVGGISSSSGNDIGAAPWNITAGASAGNVIIQVTGEAAHIIDWNTSTEVT